MNLDEDNCVVKRVIDQIIEDYCEVISRENQLPLQPS